jgi:hypothetical protein
LELLILSDKDFASLVSTFLDARLLILDVIPWHAGFYEAANQVPYMRVAPVTGISVRDDERTVVDLGSRRALIAL